MNYNLMFKWCVDFLKFLAFDFGTTYEIINVWIFCFIEPVIALVLLIIIGKQWWAIQKLKRNRHFI